MRVVGFVEVGQVLHLHRERGRQRIDRARRIDERVGKVLHLPQRDERASFIEDEAQWFVPHRIVEVAGLRLHDARCRRRAVFDDAAVAADHGRRGEAQHLRAAGEEFLEQRPVRRQQRAHPIEIDDGEPRLLKQRAALRLPEDAGDFAGGVDEAPNVLQEGGIQHAVERHRPDHGHQQRGKRGDPREQGHHAEVDARARRLRPPGRDQPARLGEQQPHEEQADRRVEGEQRQHDLARGPDRRVVGEDEQRRQRAHQGDGDRDRAEPREPAALAASHDHFGRFRLRHALLVPARGGRSGHEGRSGGDEGRRNERQTPCPGISAPWH